MSQIIDRRKFLEIMGIGTAAFAVNGLNCSKKGLTGTPNIVVLFADDLGYGDLGSFGHPTIRTTNLDKMAGEGIRLTSFYAAAPSCTPSRAALLTGRYPLRSGLPHVLMPESENGILESEITIAEALKEHGYRTKAIGKWHLGHAKEEFLPTSNGFDSYYGLLYSNDMIKPWVQTDKPLQLYRDTEPIEHPVDQTTLTVRYTDEAVNFINTAKNEPFFLYLAYSMPHLPIYTTDDFKGKSRAGHYGDVIETIDWSVGRILESLKEHGIDNNTVVVFTSDNGPWLNLPARMLQKGNKPWHAGSPGLLRGSKGNTYEGGMRVPGIIRWPGQIPAGQISAEMATTMDLYATLLTAAGANVPSDRAIDGNDIMPMIKGESPSPTNVFYYFRGNELEAVREGKWKFRFSNHTRPERTRDQEPEPELFNLDVDPSERYNVAKEHPGVMNRMREMMDGFAGEFRK